jgi:hypothetical protein
MISRPTRGLLAAAGEVGRLFVASLGWIWAAGDWLFGEVADAVRYAADRRRAKRRR